MGKTKKVKGTKQTLEFVEEPKKFRVKPIKCKSKKLKEFLEAIESHIITLCNGIPGSGKAQPKNIIIPTSNGYKAFGDLKIGDRIFDRTGKETTVLNTYEQGTLDNYKVTFSDGRYTYCNNEHLWSVYTSRGNLKTVTVQEMLDHGLFRSSHPIYKIPLNGAVEYSEKKFEVSPYVIGAFLGDGCCLEKPLTISSKDEEVVAYLAHQLNAVSYTKCSTANYSWVFKRNELSGKGNRCNLQTSIVLGKYKDNIIQYCYNKSIPEEYKFGSVELRKELLRGLLDTDGSVDKRARVSFFTLSEKLAKDVQELCWSLGYISTIYIDKREKYVNSNGVGYSVSIQCPLLEKLSLFRLTRKKERILNVLNDTTKRRQLKERLSIINIEKVGVEEMMCILVDNPEHLYLTNNYLVTHNTFLACYAALKMLEKKQVDKIVLVKSVTTLPEEDLGYLPGSEKDKMAPFILSFTGNIDKLIGEEERKKLFKDNKIVVQPIAYIRGITIDNAVVILDECLNLTIDTFKSIITRIGSGSTYIVLGDSEQIDLKRKEKSSLSKLMELFQNSESVSTISFREEDCVRNPIIPYLLNKIKEIE